MTREPGGPGSTRARLRLVAVALLALLAAVWAFIGLRLYFAPPAGISGTIAALIGLVAVADALAYGLAARWVATRKRWGHFLAIGVVALNLLFGFTAGMTWLEWSVLAINVVVLALLLATVPLRR